MNAMRLPTIHKSWDNMFYLLLYFALRIYVLLCYLFIVKHNGLYYYILRLLELAPRRTSSRVLQKIKQKEEETKQSTHDGKEEEERKETPDLARENRAKRRNLLR